MGFRLPFSLPMPAAEAGQSGTQLRDLLVRGGKWYLGSTEFFWGFTDVVIRFYIAGYFISSGLVKALDWQTAVLLATEEYPVTWMEPVVAASIGVSIEVGAAVLFFIGLLTRPAAAAMAALTVISQIVYTPTTTNLLITAILLWYVLGGPARFSVDQWLARRFAKSEQGLAGRVCKVAAWSRETLAPIFMALSRFWLGITLLVFADVVEPPIAILTWLPTTIFLGFPDWLAIVCAALVFAGFAASPVSYLLSILMGALMIAGAHPNVTLFPFLYLSIYEAKGAGVFSVDGLFAQWKSRRAEKKA